VLDEYLGFDSWKQTDEDPFYDWKLVKKVCGTRLLWPIFVISISG